MGCTASSRGGFFLFSWLPTGSCVLQCCFVEHIGSLPARSKAMVHPADMVPITNQAHSSTIKSHYQLQPTGFNLLYSGNFLVSIKLAKWVLENLSLAIWMLSINRHACIYHYLFVGRLNLAISKNSSRCQNVPLYGTHYCVSVLTYLTVSGLSTTTSWVTSANFMTWMLSS